MSAVYQRVKGVKRYGYYTNIVAQHCTIIQISFQVVYWHTPSHHVLKTLFSEIIHNFLLAMCVRAYIFTRIHAVNF